jgi:hypothetical protein
MFRRIPTPFLFSHVSPDDGLPGPKYVVSGIVNTFIRVTSQFSLASTTNMCNTTREKVITIPTC